MYKRQILSAAAGPFGMVAGQAHDKSAEGKEIGSEELQLLDYYKTGCLLCAPIDMAAVISNASEETRNILHQFGEHLGLLFQITDDLLDQSGILSEMGKKPGQDIADGKSTYVTILGVNQARLLAKKEMELALKIIEHLEYKDILTELLHFIYTRVK